MAGGLAGAAVLTRRRAGAERPVVALAGAVIVLALVVVTAAPLAVTALTEAGLQRRLVDAPSRSGTEATVRGEAAELPRSRTAVEEAVAEHLGAYTTAPWTTALGPTLDVADDDRVSVGPMVVTAAGLTASEATNVAMRTRALAEPAAVALDQRRAIAAAIEDLRTGLTERVGASRTAVVTELPQQLASATVEVATTRSAVPMTILQLVLLALLALSLAAGLLVDRRTVETALVRSRGGSSGQLVAASLVEGLALTVPAVLVAPWLGVATVSLLGRVGPLAALEVPLETPGHGRDLPGDRVGLGARAGHRPHELSGGEQQRVAVARAVARRPTLLLADEPTAQLDRETAVGVVTWLRELVVEEGATILMVTHETEVIDGVDRAVEPRDGRLTPV